MSKVQKVSIALTPAMQDDLRAAVASGQYASTSEVVREALRAWSAGRDHRQRAVAELQELIAEGHASGSAAYEGMAPIKAEGRRRLAESGNESGSGSA